MTQPALEAIKRITIGTRFESRLYLVGGAIRDEMLGITHNTDFDLVTTESSIELAELLTSISSIHPVTYPRFGTAMVKIEGADIELVTARAESYDELSRKPNVTASSLEEDAYRRDFTVNTLMRNLHTGDLLDLTGRGLEDLQNKTLQTPRDPDVTFFDDPLRMMRAVRFRWKLAFDPAPGLYESIASSKERLKIVSMERIKDELVKMLLHPSAPEALNDLMALGLLDIFAPEFRAMVDCEQGKYHHKDVWGHTLKVVDNAWSPDLVLTLAALFHDVGKPPTRFIDDKGDTRFFGHEDVGGDMTKEIMRRLKFSQREVEQVALLVKNHMRLGSAKTFSSTAARRLIRDLGDETQRLLDLVDADMHGLKEGVKVMNLDAIRDRIQEVGAVTPPNRLVSPLSGEEIMILTRLEAGPRVGEIKNALAEQVLEGKLDPDDKASATQFVLENYSLL